MPVLTLKGGIGSTETIFVFKIIGYIGYLESPRVSWYCRYSSGRSLFRFADISWHLSYPQSPFISVCGYISTSSHISNRRLFRFAKISRHLSHIIERLIIAIFIGLINYHDSSIIRAYQSIIASLSRHNESKGIRSH